MDKTEFRKITSRILRHSGFITKMDKITKEYELFDKSSPSPTPILYCRPITISEAEVIENYLCFRVENKLNETHEKLYKRMINRFTRLAPSINISLEDETEPVFTDEQIEKLEQLITEHETKGDAYGEENN